MVNFPEGAGCSGKYMDEEVSMTSWQRRLVSSSNFWNTNDLSGQNLPVNIAGTFTWIVYPVFSKFDRETMKGLLCKTQNKAFHYLFGQSSRCSTWRIS